MQLSGIYCSIAHDGHWISKVDFDTTDGPAVSIYKVYNKAEIVPFRRPIFDEITIRTNPRYLYDRYLTTEVYIGLLQNVTIINDYIVRENGDFVLESISRARQTAAAPISELHADKILYKTQHHTAINSLARNLEKPALHIQGTFAYCYNHNCHNYYHWHLQVLAAIYLLITHGYSGKFLFPRSLLDWQKATLSHIGISDDDIFFYDKEIPTIFEKIIYPSLSWMQNHGSMYMFPHETYRVFDLIKSNTIGISQPKVEKKKLYLSRIGQPSRQMTNEADLAHFFSRLGFEIVHPETMNFSDQVRLFSNADHIAGPPGAAYTNLLYCSEGAKVIQFNHTSFYMPLWERQSVFRNLHHFSYIDYGDLFNSAGEQGASGHSRIERWEINIQNAVDFTHFALQQG